MSPERRQETSTKSQWSILHGRYIPEIAFYEGRVKKIQADINATWKEHDAAPRIMVADIVQDAVSISQPEIFTETDLRKQVEKDIGSSVFATYSYNDEKLSVTEGKFAEEKDIVIDDMAVLQTLEALLRGSDITLPSGQNIDRVCKAAIFHILLKQRGRAAELPPADYP